jgi:hypothetical protein
VADNTWLADFSGWRVVFGGTYLTCCVTGNESSLLNNAGRSHSWSCCSRITRLCHSALAPNTSHRCTRFILRFLQCLPRSSPIDSGSSGSGPPRGRRFRDHHTIVGHCSSWQCATNNPRVYQWWWVELRWTLLYHWNSSHDWDAYCMYLCRSASMHCAVHEAILHCS